MSAPNPVVWYVYSADRHLVATYASQAAAASHVASWPAASYSTVPPSLTTGLEDTGPSTSTTVV